MRLKPIVIWAHTVEDMDENGGLRVPHAARIISGVALRRESNEQSADGPFLQQVRLYTEKIGNGNIISLCSMNRLD